MSDAMDVDIPVNFHAGNFELAQTNDLTLAFVLWSLARARSQADINMNAIIRSQMYDFRPLLKLRKYNEVAEKVLERISLCEYIPY